MFGIATQKAMAYTKPLFAFVRNLKGDTECGVAPFIVLNEDGWVLTAAHNVIVSLACQQHQPLVETYQKKVQEILNRPHGNAKNKEHLIKQLEHDDNWITDFALVFANGRVAIERSEIWHEADLAAIKLGNSKVLSVESFPKWNDPEDEILLGTSLCRLGYAFFKIETGFDAATRQFDFSKLPSGVPAFVNDGILSRNLVLTNEKQEVIKYIETSTPGLKGQSGGPIYSQDGAVCGVQLATNMYDLEFDAKYKRNDKEAVERQFFNVGRGVHSDTVLEFLKKHQIAYYTWAPEEEEA